MNILVQRKQINGYWLPHTAAMAFLLGLSFAPAAYGSDALVRAKNCLICHAQDKAVLGPSFTAIKKRYSGQDVSKILAGKIVRGSAGAWGALPMPANPQVTEAESLDLAKWILGVEK